jgi:toxin ParE1/3/4
MHPAIFTPRARRDLLLAVSAIARDSPRAARRFPERVAKLAKQIGQFPDLGAHRPEIVSPPFRVAPIRGYPHPAIYDPSTSPPVIARILHGSRDLAAILQDLSSNPSQG